MAVIYLPEDPRVKMIGQGLAGLAGNVLQAGDTSHRVKAMRDAIAQGKPLADVEALAGPNVEAQKFAQQLATAQTQQQQIEQSKANVNLIGQKVKESTANIALIGAEQKLDALKAQLAPAQAASENARNLAEADRAKAEAGLLHTQIDQTNTYIQALKSFGASTQPDASTIPTSGDNVVTPPGGTAAPASEAVAAPTAPVRPSPTTGLPSDYDLSKDTLSSSIGKVEKWNQLQSKTGGMVPKGFKAGQSLQPREEQTMNDLANLSETFRQMLDLAKPGPGSKLLWGPIGGRIAQLKAQFDNDPAASRDPNIAYQALTGHEMYSTITGFGSGTRGGVRLMEILQSILANAKEGRAMNIQQLQQSARIIRQSAGDLAQSLVARRPAQEIPTDALKLTQKNTQDILTYNPLKSTTTTTNASGRQWFGDGTTKIYSDDGGKTFFNEDGTPYKAPTKQ